MNKELYMHLWSGSGSSVFALFDKEVDLADCYPGCFVWTGICEV